MDWDSHRQNARTREGIINESAARIVSFMSLNSVLRRSDDAGPAGAGWHMDWDSPRQNPERGEPARAGTDGDEWAQPSPPGDFDMDWDSPRGTASISHGPKPLAGMP